MKKLMFAALTLTLTACSMSSETGVKYAVIYKTTPEIALDTLEKTARTRIINYNLGIQSYPLIVKSRSDKQIVFETERVANQFGDKTYVYWDVTQQVDGVLLEMQIPGLGKGLSDAFFDRWKSDLDQILK